MKGSVVIAGGGIAGQPPEAAVGVMKHDILRARDLFQRADGREIGACTDRAFNLVPRWRRAFASAGRQQAEQSKRARYPQRHGFPPWLPGG